MNSLINLVFASTIFYNEVVKVEKHYYEMLREYWNHYNYLTPEWWFLILLSIVAPIVWWKLLDKSRIFEITTYGLFLGMIAIILDSIGSSLMLWTYPVRISPYIYPQLYPWDIALVIIPFMLIYQWFPTFKKFLVATVLTSSFISFIAEPFMEWLKIYQPLTWKYYYSFVIYILIALLCKWILQFMKKKSQP